MVNRIHPNVSRQNLSDRGRHARTSEDLTVVRFDGCPNQSDPIPLVHGRFRECCRINNGRLNVVHLDDVAMGFSRMAAFSSKAVIHKHRFRLSLNVRFRP